MDKNKKEKDCCPFPFSLCCGTPKLRKKHAIGWSLLASFFLIWASPFGWLVLNFIGPSIAIQEYSDLHSSILKVMHASRSKKFAVLHEQLVSFVCQKYFTAAMLMLYHLVILTQPGKYIGISLLLMFIIVIYQKIYSFNNFMRHITQLKDDYKKNPEKTQEKYDQEINTFIQ